MLTYPMEERGALPLYEYLCRRIRADILSAFLPAGHGSPPSGRWQSICVSPLSPWRVLTASWKQRAIYRPGPNAAFSSLPWSRPHRLLSARF